VREQLQYVEQEGGATVVVCFVCSFSEAELLKVSHIPAIMDVWIVEKLLGRLQARRAFNKNRGTVCGLDL
jgi:hypothetical protein